jgi:hypothetical protein
MSRQRVRSSMSPREPDPTAITTAASAGQPLERLEGLLNGAQEAARGMLEAEDALRLLRERFDSNEDPAARGELATEALDQVERQLELTRERRQQLDSIEGRLWARRNQIERFLIDVRGRAWWRARRDRARAQTLASVRK